MKKENYLSVKEITKLAGVCKDTTQRWIRESKFPAERQVEVYRAKEKDVLEFLKKREERRKELEEKRINYK